MDVRRQPLPLDGNPAIGANAPKVYGASGLEVGDLVGGSPPELILGAMDGSLLVYGIDAATGDFVLLPIFQEKVEGAVGMFNSIVVADLDGNGINELYVAGSLGLRRWVQ